MATDTSFNAEVKRETPALIELAKERTAWKLDRILRSLGITKSRYHA